MISPESPFKTGLQRGALWDHVFPFSPQPFDPIFGPPVRSTIFSP